MIGRIESLDAENKPRLKVGRIRTHLCVLNILALANLIYLSKMDDACVKTIFEKDTCNMVWGALVLILGVGIGTLYKLLGRFFIDGCNSFVVPKSGGKNLVVSREKTMLWHQRLGHIGEKGLQILNSNGMVNGMYNFSLDFGLCEYCVYGKKNRVSFPSGAKREK